MEELFLQFTREKQFIDNVSPRTLEAYGGAGRRLPLRSLDGTTS